MTSPSPETEPRDIPTLALGLCWGLVVFDLILGGTASLWPDGYLALFHPELDAPQIDLIRRMGMVWLVLAAVALRAATASPSTRPRWLLVLAVVRLTEVPADVVYVASMSGASLLSHLLVASAPPLNLAIGLYLYKLSKRA
ncbi:hypothetical protein [Haliangium sp.]|uniref:hypothetical protein n=1 Tax=Haliangium sp. TaxID=2663208 RepID=UPI003D10C919